MWSGIPDLIPAQPQRAAARRVFVSIYLLGPEVIGQRPKEEPKSGHALGTVSLRLWWGGHLLASIPSTQEAGEAEGGSSGTGPSCQCLP